MYKDTMINLIKKYKWNSLFISYFKKFVIIIFIPFLILISLIFILYKNNASNFLARNISNDYYSLYHDIDNALNEANTLIEFQASTPAVTRFIFSGKIDFSSDRTTTNLENMSSFLSTFASASSNVNNITIYSYTNNYVYSTSAGCSVLDNFRKKELIEKIKKLNKSSKSFITIMPDDNPSFLNVVKVTNLSEAPLSICIITLNMHSITTAGMRTYIDNIFLEYNGDIIYCTENNYNKAELDEISKKAYLYSLGGNDIDVSRRALKSPLSYNINLTAVLISEYYDSYTAQLVFILIISVTLSIVLPIILSFYFSAQYYNSISKITYQLQHDIAGEVSSENTDELNFITSNISLMSEKLKNTEDILSEKLLALEKMKIQILQSQINPHFIFNTLNSINLYMLNIFDENCDAVIMLSSLSDMISELINSKSYMTTIFKELEYAKRYITIEQIKHMYMFDIDWDIDKKLLNCRTAKMILQPIIENSLFHGIYPLIESHDTFIKVSVQRSGNNIKISVYDNGKGFDEDTLKTLSQKLSTCALPNTKHIGLLNVNFRIKTIYGNDYGITIQNKDTGSETSILLPYTE